MLVWDARILAYWAEKLGVNAQIFAQAGISVHFDTDRDHRVLVYTHGDCIIVRVPQRRQIALSAPLPPSLGDEALAEWLQTPLTFLWRDFIYYADTPMPGDAAHPQVRQLFPSDEASLKALQSQCDAGELEMSEINISDVMPLGYFEGETLIGAASLLQKADAIFDIGVLTHPAYRGRNIGTTLTRHLRNYLAGRGEIAQYMTADINVGSRRIAEKCGFQRFMVEVGYAC